MKYAGTVFFPVLESKATAISLEQADFLTEQALCLSRIIHGDKAVLKMYQDFENNIQSVFGPAEDLTLEDYSLIDQRMADASTGEKRKALLALAQKTGDSPALYLVRSLWPFWKKVYTQEMSSQACG